MIMITTFQRLSPASSPGQTSSPCHPPGASPPSPFSSNTSMHLCLFLPASGDSFGVKWKFAILPLKWPLVHMLLCGNCTKMYYYQVYNYNIGRSSQCNRYLSHYYWTIFLICLFSSALKKQKMFNEHPGVFIRVQLKA